MFFWVLSFSPGIRTSSRRRSVKCVWARNDKYKRKLMRKGKVVVTPHFRHNELHVLLSALLKHARDELLAVNCQTCSAVLLTSYSGWRRKKNQPTDFTVSPLGEFTPHRARSDDPLCDQEEGIRRRVGDRQSHGKWRGHRGSHRGSQEPAHLRHTQQKTPWNPPGNTLECLNCWAYIDLTVVYPPFLEVSWWIMWPSELINECASGGEERWLLLRLHDLASCPSALL